MRSATLQPDVKSRTKLTPAKDTAPAAIPAPPESPPAVLLRRTIMALAILLTFEGLLRKLEPGVIGIMIFLLKDVVIVYLAFQLLRFHRLSSAINFISVSYLTVAVFIVPNFLQTMGHDPLLAIFGAKEYLLYPIVGLATFTAFENAPVSRVIQFARFLAFLMIPAGLVAILQTQLPVDSWINLSVDGESLEGFSSAGHLRVSSTFSFVSQFCCFLNMQMFMVFLALHGGMKKMTFFQKLMLLAPVPLLIICSYLTGSRGAVIGNTMVLVFAVGLACMRLEFAKLLKFVWIAAAIGLVVIVFQALSPDLMATYTTRERGHAFGVSHEIQGRIWDAFFGWTPHVVEVPLFGNGLGLMSNGSEAISSYSRNFRIASGWTETDFATTLVEGGPYLMIVWYLFRYYIIFQTTRRFLFQTSKTLFLPGAFCQAYVILVGLTGTLGIQPPISIWWWLSVGLSTIIWWRSIHPFAEDLEPEPEPAHTKLAPAAAPKPQAALGPFTVRKTPAPAEAATVSPPAPAVEPTPPPSPLPPGAKPIRGRSSYANRLHRR
jgi:hypothetical protein